MPQAALDARTIDDWLARVRAERARTAPPDDFAPLPDIPARRYTDGAFFELSRARLWRRSWLYCAHIDQLPAPGDYVVWHYGSAPIVLIHGDDGEVRAFYNTCRHRGAPVARGESGRANPFLTCGYHGWSYDRSGRLHGITEGRDWGERDHSCRALHAVRCARFANWLFVCEDPDTESLEDFLAPIACYLRHLDLGALRLIDRAVFTMRCHFNVALENFLEGYHFKLLHPGTTDRIFDYQGTSVHLWRNGHSMMLSPNRRPDWSDPGVKGLPEMAGATVIERDNNPSYCLFPNLIVPIAPSGIPCVAMWPRSVAETTLEVLWFAPHWGVGARPTIWDTRIANFARIAAEDIQFCDPMQQSISSPGFTGVPLCYQERRIYHWHEEADRRIGAEHVPAALRVLPRLGHLIE